MTDIIRKKGDTLVIPFTLSAEDIPDGATWVGATAKMNIRTSDAATLIVDHGTCTFDDSNQEGQYRGTTPAPANQAVGSYLYEVEVTFADGMILTFPNNAKGMKLKIVDEQG